VTSTVIQASNRHQSHGDKGVQMRHRLKLPIRVASVSERLSEDISLVDSQDSVKWKHSWRADNCVRLIYLQFTTECIDTTVYTGWSEKMTKGLKFYGLLNFSPPHIW